MSTLQEILSYLQQETRNKIVFCKDGIDGISFIDVGLDLAELIKESADDGDRNAMLYKQVLDKTSSNDVIGNYLAIENIGILFESELRLDVRNIIDSYSKNQCLIVKAEGVIKDDVFYFVKPEDGVKVSLEELSHYQI